MIRTRTFIHSGLEVDKVSKSLKQQISQMNYERERGILGGIYGDRVLESRGGKEDEVGAITQQAMLWTRIVLCPIQGTRDRAVYKSCNVHLPVLRRIL